MAARSVILRKFVTTWDAWAPRWTDPQMMPWGVPFLVADCGAGDYYVGPYVSERGEIRADLVRYRDLAAAAHELNLFPKDFVPAAAWAKGLAPLGEEVAASVAKQLGVMTSRLNESPPNRMEYLKIAVELTEFAMDAWRAYHADENKPDLPLNVSRVLPHLGNQLSDAAVARLAARDHRISVAAAQRLATLTGRAPRMPGGT